MDVITIIISILISQTTAQFFDYIEESYDTYETKESFGDMWNDVVSDVTVKIDCTVWAVERVLSLGLYGDSSQYDEYCKNQNENVEEESVPDTIEINQDETDEYESTYDTSDSDRSYNYTRETIPRSDYAVAASRERSWQLSKDIQESISNASETLRSAFDGNNAYENIEKIQNVQKTLKNETDRLEEVSDVLSREFDKLPSILGDNRVVHDNKEPTMENVLEQLKQLYQLEQHDKQASEISDIRQTFEDVLSILGSIGDNLSDDDEIKEIIKKLEKTSDATVSDITDKLSNGEVNKKLEAIELNYPKTFKEVADKIFQTTTFSPLELSTAAIKDATERILYETTSFRPIQQPTISSIVDPTTLNELAQRIFETTTANLNPLDQTTLQELDQRIFGKSSFLSAERTSEFSPTTINPDTPFDALLLPQTTSYDGDNEVAAFKNSGEINDFSQVVINNRPAVPTYEDATTWHDLLSTEPRTPFIDTTTETIWSDPLQIDDTSDEPQDRISASAPAVSWDGVTEPTTTELLDSTYVQTPGWIDMPSPVIPPAPSIIVGDQISPTVQSGDIDSELSSVDSAPAPAEALSPSSYAPSDDSELDFSGISNVTASIGDNIQSSSENAIASTSIAPLQLFNDSSNDFDSTIDIPPTVDVETPSNDAVDNTTSTFNNGLAYMASPSMSNYRTPIESLSVSDNVTEVPESSDILIPINDAMNNSQSSPINYSPVYTASPSDGESQNDSEETIDVPPPANSAPLPSYEDCQETELLSNTVSLASDEASNNETNVNDVSSMSFIPLAIDNSSVVMSLSIGGENITVPASVVSWDSLGDTIVVPPSVFPTYDISDPATYNTDTADRFLGPSSDVIPSGNTQTNTNDAQLYDSTPAFYNAPASTDNLNNFPSPALNNNAPWDQFPPLPPFNNAPFNQFPPLPPPFDKIPWDQLPPPPPFNTEPWNKIPPPPPPPFTNAPWNNLLPPPPPPSLMGTLNNFPPLTPPPLPINNAGDWNAPQQSYMKSPSYNPPTPPAGSWNNFAPPPSNNGPAALVSPFASPPVPPKATFVSSFDDLDDYLDFSSISKLFAPPNEEAEKEAVTEATQLIKKSQETQMIMNNLFNNDQPVGTSVFDNPDLLESFGN